MCGWASWGTRWAEDCCWRAVVWEICLEVLWEGGAVVAIVWGAWVAEGGDLEGAGIGVRVTVFHWPHLRRVVVVSLVSEFSTSLII